MKFKAIIGPILLCSILFNPVTSFAGTSVDDAGLKAADDSKTDQVRSEGKEIIEVYGEDISGSLTPENLKSGQKP
jgi:hypothetical protein